MKHSNKIKPLIGLIIGLPALGSTYLISNWLNPTHDGSFAAHWFVIPVLIASYIFWGIIIIYVFEKYFGGSELYDHKIKDNDRKVQSRGDVAELNKYKEVPEALSLHEKTLSLKRSPNANELMVAPGAFPVCAVCGKDCKTLTGKDHILVLDVNKNPSMPMLCKECKGVVCLKCASEKRNQSNDELCPKCDSSSGLDWLLPSVSCISCGKNALILNSEYGKATYQPMDKGVIPLFCTDCNSINCLGCMQNNKKCFKCGSSELGFFVPGYQNADAAISGIDEERGIVSIGIQSKK